MNGKILGIVLLAVCALVALVSLGNCCFGVIRWKIALLSGRLVRRDDDPAKFWTFWAIFFIAGVESTLLLLWLVSLQIWR
jgi:hypothetical protein